MNRNQNEVHVEFDHCIELVDNSFVTTSNKANKILKKGTF